MRLGIDIDGCMYQWERTARYLLREKFGYPKSGPLGQPSTHWNYLKDHVSPEHYRWLWKGGIEAGLFRHGHIVKGTMTTLRALAAEGHELVIITHRPKAAVNDTLEWLAFLRLPLAGIHILTGEEPKSEVPCDVYLDDKIENIEDYLANTGGLVVLMKRPHSAGRIVRLDSPACMPRLRSVDTWEAFAEIVRGMA